MKDTDRHFLASFLRNPDERAVLHQRGVEIEHAVGLAGADCGHLVYRPIGGRRLRQRGDIDAPWHSPAAREVAREPAVDEHQPIGIKVGERTDERQLGLSRWQPLGGQRLFLR